MMEGQAQPSLQDAFGAFLIKRKAIQKRNKAVTKQALAANADRAPAVKDALREKFLQQCLSYQGIPYSARYHQDPSSPHFNAPLYLDCCGLVRRALRDLKDDFGFEIGRYHQTYQMDTLPNQIPESEMRPGDLVFTQAPLYDTSKTPKQNNITHVEIWMGDGKKVLGARWAKSVVEVHDTYEFTSKKYGPNKYTFHSIDTWLRGICKSHVPERPWNHKVKKHAKSSVFADSDDEDADGDAE